MILWPAQNQEAIEEVTRKVSRINLYQSRELVLTAFRRVNVTRTYPVSPKTGQLKKSSNR